LDGIAGRRVEVHLVDPQVGVDGFAQLVHRGAAGDEVLHHLRRDRRRIGRDAARRDTVVAGEDDGARVSEGRRMASLPDRQPGGQFLEPAQRARRFCQLLLAQSRGGPGLEIGSRQMRHQRADLLETYGGETYVGVGHGGAPRDSGDPGEIIHRTPQLRRRQPPAVVPAFAAAGLAVLAGIALTGAFHEDGLADTADGFGGGHDRETKLAIMRDSNHGSFAILALVFSVGLRGAALATIGDPIHAGLVLLAAHAASRGALPAMMHLLKPARADGLGFTAGRPSRAVALIAAVIGIAIALAALGPARGAIALLLAAAGIALVAMLAAAQVGR